jgi:hypothetical protein
MLIGAANLLGWILLLAPAIALAAERAPEKIRIAVSSKSLGFLDTWAAVEKYGAYGETHARE